MRVFHDGFGKCIKNTGLQIFFFTWKDICPSKIPSWSDKTKLWSDRCLFIVAVKWFMIKKLSGHYVRPQLGFHRTWANFGRPMSDDRLLFAALKMSKKKMLLANSRISWLKITLTSCRVCTLLSVWNSMTFHDLNLTIFSWKFSKNILIVGTFLPFSSQKIITCLIYFVQSKPFSKNFHDPHLNSMTLQDWKMKFSNSMTFQVFHNLTNPVM